ncbi:MAG: hypothetical protein GY741_16430 [Phycisphaeraceae bacterium]|nr:hypothetical protein [Phycisphaeraceae bacterium]
MAVKPKGVGRRTRYSPAERANGVVMLRASAEENGGRPNLARCEKLSGVSRGTLRTWWRKDAADRHAGKPVVAQVTRSVAVEVTAPPKPLGQMGPVDFAEWRAENLAAIIQHAAKSGAISAVPAIDKRLTEHHAVVVAASERAKPTADRYEALRQRAIDAGLVEE